MIASDCSVDVSIALADWIKTVPDGSTIVFPPTGCYRTERAVRLDGRVNLTIDGAGSVFRRTEASPPELRYPIPNPHWWIMGGRNISITDVRVEGTNTNPDMDTSDPDHDPGPGCIPKHPVPSIDAETGRENVGCYLVDYEFEAAFRVQDVRGFTASDLDVYAVWGDGIQLQGSRDVSVADVSIDKNGRQGIALINTSKVLIDRVSIPHSRRGGVDLENDLASWTISGVEIRNSTIGSYLLAFPAGGQGPVNDVYIHDNFIDCSGVPFLYDDGTDGIRRKNWRIHRNVLADDCFLGSPQAAILIVETDNIEIIGNVIHLSPYMSRKAIELRSAGGTIKIQNNLLDNASSSYVKDAATGTVTACGNALVVGAPYDQPKPCNGK